MPRRKDPRKLAQDTAVAAVWLPRDQLTRWDKNPRKHTDRSLAVTRQSIERFGFVAPIIVWTSQDRMVAGHGRLKAYDALVEEHGPEWAPKHAPGPGLVPVRLMEFDSEEEANAYAIVDNRTTELSEWDNDALAIVLSEFGEDLLSGFDDDLGDLLLWTEKEMNKIRSVAASAKPSKGAGGFSVDQYTPSSVVGQVYQLGPHRIAVGDSTDPAVWDSLGIPDRAMLVTSPPYNAGADASLRVNGAQGPDSFYEGDADDKSDDEYRAFLNAFTNNAINRCYLAVVNIQPIAGAKRGLFRWISDQSENLIDVAVWDKGHAAPSYTTGVMNSDYELLVLLTKGPGASRRIPGADWRGTMSAIHRAPGMRGNDLAHVHRAVYPEHIPEWAVSVADGGACALVDCFTGTGTTMLVADRCSLPFYGIELSPLYADIVRMRWTQIAIASGRDPGPDALDPGPLIRV